MPNCQVVEYYVRDKFSKQTFTRFSLQRSARSLLLPLCAPFAGDDDAQKTIASSRCHYLHSLNATNMDTNDVIPPVVVLVFLREPFDRSVWRGRRMFTRAEKHLNISLSAIAPFAALASLACRLIRQRFADSSACSSSLCVCVGNTFSDVSAVAPPVPLTDRAHHAERCRRWERESRSRCIRFIEMSTCLHSARSRSRSVQRNAAEWLRSRGRADSDAFVIASLQ